MMQWSSVDPWFVIKETVYWLHSEKKIGARNADKKWTETITD